MKFKLVTVVAIVAVSMVALGSYQSGVTSADKRRPAPVVPKQPTFPSFPGFRPTTPVNPTIPTIPLPRPDGGPEVPFPLDATLPFPWGNIEGIWSVALDDCYSLFSFKVETDFKGKQYLHVLQIDHSTGTLLAEGVGLSVENDKLVRAAMTSKVNGEGSYMLFIGSYKNTSQVSIRGQTTKTITVLTVRPFSDLLGDKDVRVVVTKVSNTPYLAQKSLPKPVVTY